MVTDVYVGSTANLVHRRGCHKSNCHNENVPAYNFPVYQFIRENGGWDNWSVVKLQDVNCKEDLFKIERVWVEQLGAKLNKNVPSRSQQEWVDTNREKVNACSKKYYQDHKESALKYQNQYYQDHKAEAAEYQKQYRKDHKAEAAEYHKHYYRANKEKYNTCKERVTCACGSCVLKVNLSQHHKSKKHLNFLESTK